MKKLLSFILGICFIIPCVFMLSACEKPMTSDAWDGTIDVVSKAKNGIVTIETAEELAGFAREVNSGNSYEGVTVKLMYDLDMRNRTWTPIGVGNRSDLSNAKFFSGTFDGNGKKIIGLNNENFIPENRYQKVESDFTETTVKTYQYGFFGLTENATIKDLTLAVNFTCDEENLKGDSVGGLVGFANKGLTIENCVVDGLVTGYDAVGGLVGRSYNCSQENSVIIENSTNKARVEALLKGAGVLGYLNSVNLSATINNCENSGDIDVRGLKTVNACTSDVAGILIYGWNSTAENTLIVTNNKNSGRLNCTRSLATEDGIQNLHSYAYIANSVGQGFDNEIHNYNFMNNSNSGEIYYLDNLATDALSVLITQTYPEYNSENEFNNKTNIEQ